MSESGPVWWSCTSPWELSSEVVHVWRVFLDQTSDALASSSALLSEDEKERAAKFRFQRDQRRFSVGRGALRSILGHYLKSDPGRLQFRYGPQGKPFLEGVGLPLWFNVSHSHELAIVAVSARPDLGVDVEWIRPIDDERGTAECAFSPRELEELRSLPEPLRLAGFFACWTRKEAYVKARGGGLSIALDRFSVTVAPGEPTILLEAPDDPRGGSHWGMVQLDPAPGYIGALVAPGRDWRCCYHTWLPGDSLER